MAGSGAYTYDDLIGDVLLTVPGCPQSLILRELRRAGRELLRKSCVWREWTAVAAVATQTTYLLQPQWNCFIERILEVYVDGSERVPEDYKLDQGIYLVFEPDLPQISQNPPTTTTTVSTFSAASTYAVGAKVFYNGMFWKCCVAVTVAGAFAQYNWMRDYYTGIWVHAVLRPSYNTDELPNYMFDRWGESFVAGAVSNLMAEPGRPWSDYNASEYWKRKFNDGMTRALSDAVREFKKFSKPLEA